MFFHAIFTNCQHLDCFLKCIKFLKSLFKGTWNPILKDTADTPYNLQLLTEFVQRLRLLL